MTASPDDISILGMLLADPVVIPQVMEVLRSSDFQHARERKIYEAICSIHDAGAVVTPSAVVSSIRESGGLQGIGEEYILSLPALAAPLEQAADLAKAIKLAAMDRDLRSLGRFLSTSDGTPYEALDRAAEEVSRLSGAVSARSVRQVGAAVDEVLTETLRLDSGEWTNDAIPTGYEGLDRLIIGLHRGDLVVLAARPSLGKTALALNIATNVAKRGKRALVFSLEMAEKPLVQRLIASESGVIFRRIAQGYLSRADRDRLDAVRQKLITLPIVIDDNSSITIHEMRARCRREATTRGLDVVVIDYLQLLAPEDNKEIAAVSRAIKQIARDLNIPVVALSQLNRAVEHREPPRPTLSDIRASGQIEQDADIVMALWSPTADPTTRRLEVLKQRNGPLGYTDLLFTPDCVRFEGMGDYRAEGTNREAETPQETPQAPKISQDLDLAIARRKRSAQGT